MQFQPIRRYHELKLVLILLMVLAICMTSVLYISSYALKPKKLLSSTLSLSSIPIEGNNNSLTSSNNTTTDIGSNTPGTYNESGSSTLSSTTTMPGNDNNNKGPDTYPSSDKANFGETTSTTMGRKSDSASLNHKSNHHTNYSDRDFAGDKSTSKKIDSLKNKLDGNIHNIEPRHKIPLKLPIPFP